MKIGAFGCLLSSDAAWWSSVLSFPRSGAGRVWAVTIQSRQARLLVVVFVRKDGLCLSQAVTCKCAPSRAADQQSSNNTPSKMPTKGVPFRRLKRKKKGVTRIASCQRRERYLWNFICTKIGLFICEEWRLNSLFRWYGPQFYCTRHNCYFTQTRSQVFRELTLYITLSRSNGRGRLDCGQHSKKAS